MIGTSGAVFALALGISTTAAPTPAYADQCTDPVIYEFTGVTTQQGRIFRDAIPSECTGKAYPGIFNPSTTYNYEAFTVANPVDVALCVTIDFNPEAGAVPCSTNAHASAYVGAYDPADQAANYLGDVGSSLAQPFAVAVPGLTDLIIVVTNTSGAAVCNFAINTDLCSTCGDAIVTLDEQCDLGAETATCNADCSNAICGDGYANALANEACDDGNAINGDDCDNNCTASACGNGEVAPTEDCDDGNAIDGDDCDSNCTATACGNNVVTDGEDCDDGNATNGDGCETDCTISPTCGDNTVNDGEDCDDGNNEDGDGCSAACAAEEPMEGVPSSNGCCQTGEDNGVASIALGLFIGLVLLRRR